MQFSSAPTDGNTSLENLEHSPPGIQPSAYAERHGALAASVTARQTERDGYAEIGGSLAQNAEQLAPGSAVRHLAEHDCARPGELARLSELGQHAIERIRLFVHVFKKDDPLGEVDRVRRAEQRDEDRKAAAEYPSLGDAAPKRDAEANRRRPLTAQRSEQRGAVDGGELRKVRRNHRAVKGHPTELTGGERQ